MFASELFRDGTKNHAKSIRELILMKLELDIDETTQIIYIFYRNKVYFRLHHLRAGRSVDARLCVESATYRRLWHRWPQ